MKEFDYVITDEAGIHARPAGLLVNKARNYQSDITVYKGSQSADCKKLFALMEVMVKKGDRITLKIEGPDEEIAQKELQSFLADHL